MFQFSIVSLSTFLENISKFAWMMDWAPGCYIPRRFYLIPLGLSPRVRSIRTTYNYVSENISFVERLLPFFDVFVSSRSEASETGTKDSRKGPEFQIQMMYTGRYFTCYSELLAMRIIWLGIDQASCLCRMS